MTEPEIVLKLRALGFDSGWAVVENTIVLWENDEPQPSYAELGLPDPLGTES